MKVPGVRDRCRVRMARVGDGRCVVVTRIGDRGRVRVADHNSIGRTARCPNGVSRPCTDNEAIAQVRRAVQTITEYPACWDAGRRPRPEDNNTRRDNTRRGVDIAGTKD